MGRIIFTANEEMEADLKKVANERGASLAGLIRLILAEALAVQTGKSAGVYKVEVGGNRRGNTDSEK